MAEKKKPKPGPSTGGSSTSRIKRPKGSQPLTLGTGGLRTGKVSKKQMAGTRKVVGAIAAVTPVGRAAKGVSNIAGKTINQGTRKKYTAGVYQTDGIRPGVKDAARARKISKGLEKYWKKQDRLAGVGAPKQPSYPSNLVSVRNKPTPVKRKPKLSSNKDLRPLPQRGKRVVPGENKTRAQNLSLDKAEKNYDFFTEARATGYRGGMNIKPRGPKGKNLKKQTKINKIARGK